MIAKALLLGTLLSTFWIARSFVDPCNNDPCDCDGDDYDEHCTICHPNGCNLCETGYFKADYNYPCVQCQDTFGSECTFCQDFNGCGQCSNNYIRTYDSQSGLWYCALNTALGDSVTVQIDDATFDDDYDTELPYIPEITNEVPDDPFDSSNNNAAPNPLDLLQSSKTYDVDYDTSNQFETTFSTTLLTNLINDDWYNLELQSSNGDNNDTNQTESDVDCDCSLYCDANDTDASSGNRRNLMIFPPDNRRQVYGYPYWGSSGWTGLLRVQTSATTHGGCSASLIGPNYIITAGHCVHGGKGKTWYTNRQFYPGRTINTASTSYSVVQCRTWYRWVKYSDQNWDMAVCRLSGYTGRSWFPFRNAVGFGLNERDTVYVKGYPGDKTFGSQWWTYGTVWDETSYQIRSRNYDTVGGMSGSPVYKIVNGNAVIYGVHTGWSTHWYKTWFLGSWHSYRYNRGTKINTYLYYSICQFMGKNYKNC